ncbi:MAG: type II and III secretion system protein [candidate division WS1 bacterium]|nr:type II and III secretion system protein [candidate division WS1 bacterium]
MMSSRPQRIILLQLACAALVVLLAQSVSVANQIALLELADEASPEQADAILSDAIDRLFADDAEPVRWWRDGRLLVLSGGEAGVECMADVLHARGMLKLRPQPQLQRTLQIRDGCRERAAQASADIAERMGAAIAVEANSLSVSGPAPAVVLACSELTTSGLAYDLDTLCSETVQLHHVRDAATFASLIESAREHATPHVSISSYATTTTAPTLLLTGPRHEVQDLRRIIATIDVPHPQVRLDLWAFQISGGNAEEVAERAAEARQRIDETSRLLRGYIQALQVAAVSNASNLDEETVLAQYESVLERLSERGLSDQQFTLEELKAFAVSLQGISPLLDITGAVTGIKRPADDTGPHPMGITEMMVWLIMGERSGQQLESAMSASVGSWRGRLRPERAQILSDWHGRPERASDATDLMPQNLLEELTDPHTRQQAQSAIRDFLTDYAAQRRDWRSVDPEQLRRRTADAEAVLQSAVRALSADINALFMTPLQAELQEIASDGGSSGLASSGTTSMTVLSGVEAKLNGSAMSYFNVNSAQGVEGTLQQADALATALGTALPTPERRPGIYTVKVTLAAGKPDQPVDVEAYLTHLNGLLPQLSVLQLAEERAVVLSGSEADVAAGRSMLQAMGIAAGSSPMQATDTGGVQLQPMSVVPGSAPGIPTDRLLGLALALGQEQEVWAALREGVELTFTPWVLPGGSGAEIDIDCTVTHGDGGEEAGGDANPELTRVARHNANTQVYVDAMDLFSLSSLNLRTSHPRSDYSVPVLGQLPIVGSLFRFPRSPQQVHHESVLLVQSVVLATGRELADLIELDSQGASTEPAAAE